MVTARQPAGVHPSLLPAFLEPWPSTVPSAHISAFPSQGLDKKGPLLPLGTFKRKWRQQGTRKNPRKAA